ncbi:hypothetical protein NC651_029024 [Populus alba x Populus x berolinensis]|nr:hypothetical protein NC651_029024 [Populus alba x Populus x berolinensis]
MVEVGEVEDLMTTEKMTEIAIKVLCAGMSVAMSSLTAIAAPASIFPCDLLVGKLTRDEQQISLEISGIGNCLNLSETEAHISFFIYFVIASLSRLSYFVPIL